MQFVEKIYFGPMLISLKDRESYRQNQHILYLACMVRLIIVLLLGLGFAKVNAQVCNGSLGENIFTDGNFGIGEDNNLQTDPEIAPGYIYTTIGPPSDGFYVITNSTNEWSGLYPTWLGIKDNSDDSDGYMMVVNASFDPGAFYDQIVDGLCPNTLYEFSADIINLIKTGVTDHIDPNVSFLIDGQEQYTTGNIPKTENWQTYGFTFTTGPDQTEVRLTLSNNAPGGIGNDLALDNITFRPCGPASFIDIDTDQTIFLCEEDDPLTITADIQGGENQVYSIQWQRSLDQGATWDDIGMMNQDFIIHDLFVPDTYWYRYISASNDVNLMNEKCRIFSGIIVIEVVPKISNVRDTICMGVPYIFGDRELNASGNYVDTFKSALDCDSVVFLDLTVVDDPMISYEAEITDPSCFGSQDGSILLTEISNGYPPYTIFLDGNEANRNIPSLSDGDYSLRIIDRHRCYLEEQIAIREPVEFIINTSDDQEVLLGEEIQVTTEANYPIINATWNDADGFSCNNCAEPIILPRFDAVYVLTAFNENNCVAVDSFSVRINKSDLLYMPNIFSPNQDGVNDVFYVSSYRRSVEEVIRFSVFDRWGNLVFDRRNFPSNDISFGWEGSHQLASGVYTYFLEVLLINQDTEQLSGNVTLIK